MTRRTCTMIIALLLLLFFQLCKILNENLLNLFSPLFLSQYAIMIFRKKVMTKSSIGKNLKLKTQSQIKLYSDIQLLSESQLWLFSEDLL